MPQRWQSVRGGLFLSARLGTCRLSSGCLCTSPQRMRTTFLRETQISNLECWLLSFQCWLLSSYLKASDHHQSCSTRPKSSLLLSIAKMCYQECRESFCWNCVGVLEWVGWRKVTYRLRGRWEKHRLRSPSRLFHLRIRRSLLNPCWTCERSSSGRVGSFDRSVGACKRPASCQSHAFFSPPQPRRWARMIRFSCIRRFPACPRRPPRGLCARLQNSLGYTQVALFLGSAQCPLSTGSLDSLTR